MPIILGRNAAFNVTLSAGGARGSPAAQRLLAELSTAPLEHADSRRIIAQLDRLLVGQGLMLRTTDALIASRRRVVQAITSGRLTVSIVTPRVRGGDFHGTSERASDTSPAPAASAPPPEVAPADDDYIEVRLVDEAGEPVANEPVEITLPDGDTWRSRTGRDGIARVIGIPSGMCKVTFPGLDSAAWERHSE